MGIDAVAAGPGHGGRAHAPNEHITIDTVPGIAKYTLAFMEHYTSMRSTI
jgi:acetylornithine deacetylase/succinyl-diaminopimelate desuccinylase-like protein